MGNDTEDENADDQGESKMVNYRGTVEEDVWEDFKELVPRSTPLHSKVTELIEDYVDEHADELENGGAA